MLLVLLSDNIQSHKKMIERALDLGYDITLPTIRTDKIPMDNPHLHLLEGSVDQEQVLKKALERADAVICMFKDYTQAMLKNIIHNMEFNNIRRLVFFCENTTCADQTSSKGGVFKRLTSPKAYHDADHITHSDRDWTIIFPLSPVNHLLASRHADISDTNFDRVNDKFIDLILGQITDVTDISRVVSI